MAKAKKSTTKKVAKAHAGFSAEEKAAARARVKELKAEAAGKAGEGAVLETIAKMPEPDRSIAKRLHSIVRENAPTLIPKTWYGMPAYANKDGKVVCFYQSAAKFGTRYGTVGFQDAAKLDDGAMWPTHFAVKEMNTDIEAKLAAFVKKAAG